MKRIDSALAIVCLFAALTPSLWADEMKRTISVSGQGKASAPPDLAIVTTGVVTQAEDAGSALSANNAAVRKLMEVLKNFRIASKDIQTSNFSVQPEYERGPRGRSEPRIVGYRVSNQVQARIRNLPELGRILDAVVEAGSNQIGGVSFTIDNATGLLNEARNHAVGDARSRAELYAHTAGVKVGKVLSISEQQVPFPRPQMRHAMMTEVAMADEVPMAAGEYEVQATVQMVFEMVD